MAKRHGDGDSNPNGGITERPKKHGQGYPLDVDSIERSNPTSGPSDRGKSNQHGHQYGTYPKGIKPGKNGHSL